MKKRITPPAVTEEFLNGIANDGDGDGDDAEVASLQSQVSDDIHERIHNKLKHTRTKFHLDPALRPVMSPQLENEIEMALAQYENIGKWKDWGLDVLRAQGAAVLFYGPPGCGKTVIARYMSKRVGRGICFLNMKDVGGKAPGHTDRMIANTFDTARAKNLQTIFIDECESILWDRGRAGSDSMWMVSIIDELLMQIARYKGLIVLATNRDEIVDSALKSRCFAVLQVPAPAQPERLRIWKQKMPSRFPLKLTPLQFDKLSEISLVGRQIETAIVREASCAIAQKRQPDFKSLLDIARECSKHTIE